MLSVLPGVRVFDFGREDGAMSALLHATSAGMYSLNLCSYVGSCMHMQGRTNDIMWALVHDT
jgi:hypothetical protein